MTPKRVSTRYVNTSLEKKVPESSIVIDDPNRFRWSVKFTDFADSKFGIQKLKHEYLFPEVIGFLIHYSTMTWGEILRASGGRRNGNNNHGLELDSLTPAGKNAVIRVQNENAEIDKEWPVFSLRTEGQKRILGFRERTTFHLVWYDMDHSFSKRNSS